jgi:hypothetical protein
MGYFHLAKLYLHWRYFENTRVFFIHTLNFACLNLIAAQITKDGKKMVFIIWQNCAMKPPIYRSVKKSNRCDHDVGVYTGKSESLTP